MQARAAKRNLGKLKLCRLRTHIRVTGTVSEGRECQEREMPKAWSGRGARVRRRRTRGTLCTLHPVVVSN